MDGFDYTAHLEPGWVLVEESWGLINKKILIEKHFIIAFYYLLEVKV